MKSICGKDCCEQCPNLEQCGGCIQTDGKPFGGECIAADCIKARGAEAFNELKKALISEINALGIQGLHVDDLNLLNGFFVNLAYPLPNGVPTQFLKDNKVYLGNQIERADSERCYGVVADESMILVSEYGCMGAEPELVCYKKR